MAAVAAPSPSLGPRAVASSYFAARGVHCGRDGPPSVAVLTSSSSARFPSLRLRLSPPSRFCSLLCYARRGKKTSSAARNATVKKEKKEKHVDDVEEEDMDGDAFEALFHLLEDDLKNDNMSDDDLDDEITEEDLARLEQELANALDEEDGDEEFIGESSSNLETLNDSDDEEDTRPLKLKNWQLRRLATALKNGRRKASIKNLSAELGLDRAIVLDLLREPPPNLLLMAESLPDKAAESPSLSPEQGVLVESPPIQTDVADTETKQEMPVHVMKTRWSFNKRLKKVQIETLEKVYTRTKRPTNAMISSIVHVTNLPRRTVVKWFEDKRGEDGVPDRRQPFRRSAEESVFF